MNQSENVKSKICLFLSRHALWYTSGSYYDRTLKWEGDGTLGFDDARYWITLGSQQSVYMGMRVVYKYIGKYFDMQ